MVAPISRHVGYTAIAQQLFTVEPMTPEELAFYENELKGVDPDTLMKW